MKLDRGLWTRSLAEVPATARESEQLGFDALWVQEAGNDPFLASAIAAEHTERVKVGTAVAIAFPRSPMVTACAAWDLARLARGRFILGLGTQVKGHIERRYATRWEKPVAKLREYVEALRAIFSCFAAGGRKLSYQGKFYNFSLMTPFFAPEVHDYSRIPIYVAGVNDRICELAGELCEGLHAHPFHSAKYLREFVLPHVAKGLARSGRQRSDFTIATSVFVVTGRSPEELERAKAAVRQQIAFYASTRTYAVVLETHGWNDLPLRLNAMAARGQWDSMGREITDEMLEAYAVSGTPDDIGPRIKARYEGLVDRLALYIPYPSPLNAGQWRELAAWFNGAS
jgi:probable F420-dependent oxidoreductase